jgi:hypothetical protein
MQSPCRETGYIERHGAGQYRLHRMSRVTYWRKGQHENGLMRDVRRATDSIDILIDPVSAWIEL